MQWVCLLAFEHCGCPRKPVCTTQRTCNHNNVLHGNIQQTRKQVRLDHVQFRILPSHNSHHVKVPKVEDFYCFVGICTNSQYYKEEATEVRVCLMENRYANSIRHSVFFIFAVVPIKTPNPYAM
jgi:hypothetical protein